MNRKIKRNISITVFAQAISLIVSFILSMIVPKYIDEFQYSRWQAYVLYSSYVGVLHFGLLDGIVLRYSQYDYEQLDKCRLRSQFVTMLGMLLFASLIVVLCTSAYAEGNNRKVFYLVSVSILTKNIFTYSCYLLQTTNRIAEFAKTTILQRLAYGIVVCVLLVIHKQSFVYYCLADIIGDSIAILKVNGFNKGLYFGKLLPWKDNFAETKKNIAGGILLMLANWSASLLVGAAKMVVQFHWNELTFGKISFSFSVSNLFLAFVAAISIVLFPTLKRTDPVELPSLYIKIRNMISPIMLVCMLFYFPGSWVLLKWLPKYEISLRYLGILFPIVVYTAKISLLTNNYLKAYRMEKQLFLINLIAVIFGVTLYLISAVLLNSLMMLTLSVVLVIAVRSVVSEYVVAKAIRVALWRDHLVEMAMTIGFIACTHWFSRWVGFFVYFVMINCYLLIEKRRYRQPHQRRMMEGD